MRLKRCLHNTLIPAKTSNKVAMIQRRLAWPLNTHKLRNGPSLIMIPQLMCIAHACVEFYIELRKESLMENLRIDNDLDL